MKAEALFQFDPRACRQFDNPYALNARSSVGSKPPVSLKIKMKLRLWHGGTGLGDADKPQPVARLSNLQKEPLSVGWRYIVADHLS